MDTFYFAFTIQNYDQPGQEHRLKTTVVSGFRMGSSVDLAVKELVKFAARLVGCRPDDFPTSRIMLKSAWRDYIAANGRKRARVTVPELAQALVRIGLSARGRGEHHLEKRAKPAPWQQHNPKTQRGSRQHKRGNT